MARVTLPAARLTLEESVALDNHEYTIERGLRTFYAVGNALAQIREGRLYRATHFTFEQYCQDRWNIKQSRAYQLMDAAGVVDNLKSSTIVELPANEAQARPLAQLPPDQQPAAWELARDVSPNGKPTAAQVGSAVEQMQLLPEPGLAGRSVHFLHESEEWYTPLHIIERALDFFGEIDLDPCAPDKLVPVVPARTIYTKADDGLIQSWSGRVWMNPPYGDVIGLWTRKLITAYRHRSIEAGLALVPSRTERDWFEELWDFPLCFLRGRLKFRNPTGISNSAPFGSVIACISGDREEFARCFGDLGHIVNEHRGTNGS